MTGRNPNVFYEVGYAHALGKIVLLLTQNTDDIPFDLKHHQHTVYGGSIDTLKSDLVKKLQWAVSESRHRQDTRLSELFSIRVLNILIPYSGTTEEIPLVSGIVTNKEFNLPFIIRNNSLETTSAISHIYLFCEHDIVVTPSEYVSSSVWQGNVSFGGVYPATGPPPQVATPLKPFNATPVDAEDGLTSQFRLKTTIPSLPPGAVEIINVPFLFSKQIPELDSLYRLRLHSASTHHDFTFRLKIQHNPVSTEDKASAGKKGKSSKTKE